MGGVNPLNMAAYEGFTSVVRALAELGADLNMPNNLGATSVHVAAQVWILVDLSSV